MQEATVTVQCLFLHNAQTLILLVGAPREDFPKLSADAKHLKDVTSKLVNLRLDHTEFTCLKALALFKPDVCGLRNHVQVEVLQDQTHLMLQEYCNSKAQVSSGKLRFGKILLTMPIISQVIKAIITK